NADDEIAEQYGTVGVAPPDGVGAKVLLQIAQPEPFAGEVVGGEVAVAEVDRDALAVGHRRRAGQVVQVVELLLPALSAGWTPAGLPCRHAGTDLLRPDNAARRLVDSEQ